MTREARAAQDWLPDRISLGVLAASFPAGLLDEVIEVCGARERRRRALPARLMVVFSLACWLFMRSGYGTVLGKLADAHALDERGWDRWTRPGTGAITRAKARLGSAPLRELFARVAGPVATKEMPGAFFAGRRVLAVDGFTLDLPDTEANSEHFGRGGNGSATRNPQPQLRALALAETATRALIAATYGPYARAEQVLALDLLPALRAGTLILADRGFLSWKLFTAFAATGADLCWRASASFTLPVMRVLPDGSYLSVLRPPRKRDGEAITVRVIEYSVRSTDEHGARTSEVFALVTTLLDHQDAPAEQLADLYHRRWQAETTIGELKTALRGGPEIVLRSQSPDLIAQEFWAMCCVYQAIRGMIGQATPDGLDPGRISFTHALEAARDTVTRGALSPRGTSRAR